MSEPGTALAPPLGQQLRAFREALGMPTSAARGRFPTNSFLPYPFATSNPGAMGKKGEVYILERNTIASNRSGEPSFLDTEAWVGGLRGNYNELGDANTFVKYDPRWCGAATCSALPVLPPVPDRDRLLAELALSWPLRGHGTRRPPKARYASRKAGRCNRQQACGHALERLMHRSVPTASHRRFRCEQVSLPGVSSSPSSLVQLAAVEAAATTRPRRQRRRQPQPRAQAP